MTLLPSIRNLHFFALFVLAATSITPIQAQNKNEVIAKGFFRGDSIRVGQPVAYVLTAQYPEQFTVLFPDSTYDFKPFEFVRKKIFPTVTRNGFSRDSVIYWLTSFEVNSIQSLTMPVFRVVGADSSVLETRDSLPFSAMVKQMPPDSIDASQLPLRTDTRYTQVSKRFNYFLTAVIGVGLLLILLILWFLFGKKIQRQFRIRRLTREYNKFVIIFNEHLEDLERSFSSIATEKTLFEWKKYMEHLSRRPFTKLTTRETAIMEKDTQIGEELGSVDRAIYGDGAIPLKPLLNLRKYAEKNYLKKLNELLNG